jgi:ribosomal protein S18 acetylase RimI-like enzyme
MNVIIRPATMSDLDSMVILLGQLFSIEEDFTADVLKQKKGLELLLQNQNYSKVLVAESDGQVVGMLTAQICISTAEGAKAGTLEDMIIDKNYRRKGIGRMLIQKMEDWAFQNNIKRLQLLCDKNNIPALEYYKNLNWLTTKLICLRKYPK